MFPRLDIVHPNDSNKPTPMPIIARVPTIISTAYKKENASTVERMEGDITCLFTRTGSTALGCVICLNSFLDILANINKRMHFIPPVVLPAQAPIIIITVSVPHNTEGHVI